MAPPPRVHPLPPVPRLFPLLAASCLGPVAVLLAGRAALQQLPPATPLWSSQALRWTERLSPDPWRRREAALLLQARGADGAGRRLVGQAWGRDPLAAVVLKQQALTLEAQGLPEVAAVRWRELQRRFPTSAARADADYALGRRQPALRRQLLQRFPAHPAALAAALELGPTAALRRQGALHLARWGPRWPGAAERLAAACRQAAAWPAAQRAQLAAGVVALGDGPAARRCLGPGPAGLAALSPEGRLALARSLLGGTTDEHRQAMALLLPLAQGPQRSPETDAAVRLLAQEPGADAQRALALLPPQHQHHAAVQARRLLDAPHPSTAAAVALLQRWPTDPALWDLQWELARRAVLADRWFEARQLLQAIGPAQLPAVLAARQQFWLGLAADRLGAPERARQIWRQLLQRAPGGYYGWRAAVRLGEGELLLRPATAPAPPSAPRAGWQPLASGQADLDRLWRLDQTTEAWELWRHRRGHQGPTDPAALLLEGRLRQGVGDDWIGLAQLEQASLRLSPQRCALLATLEAALHPLRHRQALMAAARQEHLALPLLLGVARQESRFSAAVQSPVGAVGLLQLMPETAAELAGEPVPTAALHDPARNAALGARYLRQLLLLWQGNPLLAVASYNAGPGAVARWRSAQLVEQPELWVEAIPYPETRLYVKKVLGYAWSYQRQLAGLRGPGSCPR